MEKKIEVISSYSLSDGCYYCGGEATTWDHIVPRKRGGGHHIANLVPACRSCNSSKNDRTLIEYRKHLRDKGLPADFDTPDPKAILGILYNYDHDLDKSVFMSVDGSFKCNLREVLNRVYVNAK